MGRNYPECGGMKMKKLLVAGPTRLSGTVRIHGAKNSVLPILAAC